MSKTLKIILEIIAAIRGKPEEFIKKDIVIRMAAIKKSDIFSGFCCFFQ